MIEALVIPPTSLVVLIIIALVLRRRRPRLALDLGWAAPLLLILLGMPIVSHNLLLALEADLPTVEPLGDPPRAIVVLGGEVLRARSEPLGVRPGPLTMDRLRSAATLARRTGLPLLVTGGKTQPDTTPVASVMAASLRDDFGTPARWVEQQSRDTWENATFSSAILRRDGIASIYLVTSAWHMRRALLAFRGTGLTITAVPTPLDDPLAPNLSDFVPRAALWQIGYYALHEWIGCAWYALRQSFGGQDRAPQPAGR